MRVQGQHYRTVWLHSADPTTVQIIDQRLLPFEFSVIDLKNVSDFERAITDMEVRGAGCIGATAGYGMYIATLQAARENPSDPMSFLVQVGKRLKKTRPTAVNLAWAVERQLEALRICTGKESWEGAVRVARETAQAIADEDAEWCENIGKHGVGIIEEIHRKKGGGVVNILTHCNAGWLAFVDFGSATAPIYLAHDKGIPVHVWVDETRPRSQGARLTAWELNQHGVPHTIIPDNTGGHLMQHGLVDLAIVGSDRTTYTGDVANKIGTYLKALAAKDNGVPFYVALPSSTFDWSIRDGVKEIPIEERGGDEVKFVSGIDTEDGKVKTVQVTSVGSSVANYGFDVTPARLVTGLITERGVCDASEEGVFGLFPEKRKTGAAQ